MQHLTELVALFERSFIEGRLYLVVGGANDTLFEVFFLNDQASMLRGCHWVLVPARQELVLMRGLSGNRLSDLSTQSGTVTYKIKTKGPGLVATFVALGISLETLERELSSALLLQISFLGDLRLELARLIGTGRVEQSERDMADFSKCLVASVRGILDETNKDEATNQQGALSSRPATKGPALRLIKTTS